MSSNPTLASRPNPYVGTRPFRKGEKLYGREQETSELLDLLIAERIVMLYSPSGAGKSSLLNASVLPKLEENGFHLLPVARVNHEPPPELERTPKFNRYVYSLLVCFEEGVPPEQRFPAAELASMRLKAYLQKYYARAEANAKPEDAPINAIVTIIDQGEEVITIDPAAREQKQEFFNQLGEALRDRSIWMLYSLREDYVARLDSYIKPIPTGFSVRYRLRLLQADAALSAIQNPPALQGVTFEDQAARKLVDELRLMKVQQPDGTTKKELGVYVEPVQLQVVCRRLWTSIERDDMEIGVDDVERAGDVNTALADYYKLQVATVAAKVGVRERAIREWFDRKLITKQGIRGQVLLAPGKSDGLENEAIRELERTYLVRAEKRGGSTWYELAHDRLVEPVLNDNRAWFDAHLSSLQRAADVWNEQGRTEGFLLFGEEYIEAEQWAAKNADIMLPVEADFLAACRKFDEAVKKEKRNNQIVRALLVLSLAALAVAVFMFILARRAENRAETGQLAADSLSVLKTDPLKSVFHALEAMQNTTPPLPAAIDALHRSLPSLRLIRTFYGHTDRVYAVSYNHDGSLLASASRDGTIKVWDASGAQTQPLQNFPINPDAASYGATAVLFNPDGSLLIAVNGKGEIIVWETATWQEVRRNPNAHPGAIIWGLALSPDGKTLATGASDSLIKLWNLADLSEIHTFAEHTDPVEALAFSPDGQMLASASLDGSSKVWNLQDYSRLASFILPSRIISNPPRMTGVSFGINPNRLITASTDGGVYVWDISTGKQVMKISGHDDWVYGITVRPGSDADSVEGEIISAGADRSIRLWGGVYGRGKLELRGHTDQVYALSLHPTDSGLLASASADKTIRIWDISWSGNYERFTEDIQTAEEIPGYAEDVDYNPQGTLLALPVSLAKSIDSPYPSYGLPGEILFIDPKTGQRTGNALQGHTAGVFTVDFNANGSRLVSASLDKTVIIWDVEKRAPLFTLEHDSPVYSADYSPNDWWIAAGTQKGDVVLWDAITNTQFASYSYKHILGENSPRKVVSQVQFNPASDQIAVQYREDENIYLIDAKTGDLKLTLTGHEDFVRDFDFSPDGTQMVSVGDDALLILWDIRPETPAEKRILRTYREHTATIFSVTYSTIQNRQYILSAGADGVVKVWELKNAQKHEWEVIYTLRAYAFANDDTLLDIEISPVNEHEVVAVVNDWTVRGFTLDNAELIRLAQERLRQNLDCQSTEPGSLEEDICTLTP